MRPERSGGWAVVDYLGAVVAVGLVMLALVAVRQHTPHRRPPLDPVGHIGAIVGPPAVLRAPTRPRIVRRPPPHPPRRAPRPRSTVLAPVWAIGW
jgi:hypothetical protein